MRRHLAQDITVAPPTPGVGQCLQTTNGIVNGRCFPPFAVRKESDQEFQSSRSGLGDVVFVLRAAVLMLTYRFLQRYHLAAETAAAPNPACCCLSPRTFSDMPPNRSLSTNGAFTPPGPAVLHWFRRALRMHDNPALSAACSAARAANAPLLHLFVLDETRRGGTLRTAFLLDALRDIDASLRARGSRLYVVRGLAETVVPRIVDEFAVRQIFYEQETAEWARRRDFAICKKIVGNGVRVTSKPGHTLYDPQRVLAANGGAAPATMASIQKVMMLVGEPEQPADAETDLPPSPSPLSNDPEDVTVPDLASLGLSLDDFNRRYEGGESAALSRMAEFLELNSGKDVAVFEKVCDAMLMV
jgi:DNA photolyase